MGWSARETELKSIPYKKRLFLQIDENSKLQFVKIEENWYIFRYFESKNKDLWEDNKEYILEVRAKQTLELANKLIEYKGFYSLKDLNTILDNDIKNMRIFRLTWHR